MPLVLLAAGPFFAVHSSVSRVDLAGLREVVPVRTSATISLPLQSAG
jgi:hypothetical protein